MPPRADEARRARGSARPRQGGRSNGRVKPRAQARRRSRWPALEQRGCFLRTTRAELAPRASGARLPQRPQGQRARHWGAEPGNADEHRLASPASLQPKAGATVMGSRPQPPPVVVETWACGEPARPQRPHLQSPDMRAGAGASRRRDSMQARCSKRCQPACAPGPEPSAPPEPRPVV